jgi:hypothetical protein
VFRGVKIFGAHLVKREANGLTDPPSRYCVTLPE